MRLFALLVAGLLDAAAPHVRPEGADLRALVAGARERSATFRGLLARLDRSDVIVYVRAQHFPTARLDGRIGFVRGMTGHTGARVLLVELACPRVASDQTATLAHELHHAAEIADAPWVRDTTTLEAYYQRIGEETTALGEGAAFETRAARELAARVARELAR
jgi:hypothetical protein